MTRSRLLPLLAVLGVGALLSPSPACGGAVLSEPDLRGPDGDADAGFDNPVNPTPARDGGANCIIDADCSNDRLCIDGSCSCPFICASVCVNIENDRLNCGDCTVACGNTEECIVGQCQRRGNASNEWANWPMPHPPKTSFPNPASYTVHDDYIVDDVTTLQWSRATKEGQTWDEATDFCRNLRAGGHANWRVPTLIELISIVDFTEVRYGVDIGIFTDVQSGFGAWTATFVQSETDLIWQVRFGFLKTNMIHRSSTSSVRCVR